ncbi:MAG: 30S ribosomal protein S20 [Bdellovibrionota bacterium]|mgnify:CR=1 FL=1
MANTRQSTKRARQAIKRQKRNRMVKSATHTSVRAATEAIKSKDPSKAKDFFHKAERALRKAASKGAVPKERVNRKISRLAALLKKTAPASSTQA